MVAQLAPDAHAGVRDDDHQEAGEEVGAVLAPRGKVEHGGQHEDDDPDEQKPAPPRLVARAQDVRRVPAVPGREGRVAQHVGVLVVGGIEDTLPLLGRERAAARVVRKVLAQVAAPQLARQRGDLALGGGVAALNVRYAHLSEGGRGGEQRRRVAFPPGRIKKATRLNKKIRMSRRSRAVGKSSPLDAPIIPAEVEAMRRHFPFDDNDEMKVVLTKAIDQERNNRLSRCEVIGTLEYVRQGCHYYRIVRDLDNRVYSYPLLADALPMADFVPGRVAWLHLMVLLRDNDSRHAQYVMGKADLLGLLKVAEVKRLCGDERPERPFAPVSSVSCDALVGGSESSPAVSPSAVPPLAVSPSAVPPPAVSPLVVPPPAVSPPAVPPAQTPSTVRMVPSASTPAALGLSTVESVAAFMARVVEEVEPRGESSVPLPCDYAPPGLVQRDVSMYSPCPYDASLLRIYAHGSHLLQVLHDPPPELRSLTERAGARDTSALGALRHQLVQTGLVAETDLLCEQALEEALDTLLPVEWPSRGTTRYHGPRQRALPGSLTEDFDVLVHMDVAGSEWTCVGAARAIAVYATTTPLPHDVLHAMVGWEADDDVAAEFGSLEVAYLFDAEMRAYPTRLVFAVAACPSERRLLGVSFGDEVFFPLHMRRVAECVVFLQSFFNNETRQALLEARRAPDTEHENLLLQCDSVIREQLATPRGIRSHVMALSPFEAWLHPPEEVLLQMVQQTVCVTRGVVRLWRSLCANGAPTFHFGVTQRMGVPKDYPYPSEDQCPNLYGYLQGLWNSPVAGGSMVDGAGPSSVSLADVAVEAQAAADAALAEAMKLEVAAKAAADEAAAAEAEAEAEAEADAAQAQAAAEAEVEAEVEAEAEGAEPDAAAADAVEANEEEEEEDEEGEEEEEEGEEEEEEEEEKEEEEEDGEEEEDDAMAEDEVGENEVDAALNEMQEVETLLAQMRARARIGCPQCTKCTQSRRCTDLYACLHAHEAREELHRVLQHMAPREVLGTVLNAFCPHGCWCQCHANVGPDVHLLGVLAGGYCACLRSDSEQLSRHSWSAFLASLEGAAFESGPASAWRRATLYCKHPPPTAANVRVRPFVHFAAPASVPLEMFALHCEGQAYVYVPPPATRALRASYIATDQSGASMLFSVDANALSLSDCTKVRALTYLDLLLYGHIQSERQREKRPPLRSFETLVRYSYTPSHMRSEAENDEIMLFLNNARLLWDRLELYNRESRRSELPLFMGPPRSTMVLGDMIELLRADNARADNARG